MCNPAKCNRGTLHSQCNSNNRERHTAGFESRHTM
nr:MAG TPA: hypothetical protein [Caudoviricetes sp.]